MFGFNLKTRQNVAAGSPRGGAAVGSPRSGEVGEIDTSAPFRSVKAAVSLFGEVASPKATPPVIKKSKTSDDERVLEKETHLHLTSKELDKFKQELKNAEKTKLQALRELEKANRTLQELKSKLENVSESKHVALEATEAAKARAKQLEESKSSSQVVPAELLNDAAAAAWKQDMDSEIQQYKASAKELNSAKQELTNLRQDFDLALAAKLGAFQEAADAKHSAKVNRDKLTTLSKEIGTLRSALGQVKLASAQAQEGQSKIMAEKEARLQSKRTAKEGVEKRICSLKEGYDPEVAGKLQEMLEETNEAIGVLQEQLNTVHDSDLHSLRIATSEVDDAKKTLQQVLEEKSWLGRLVESLKLELEKVRRDNKELMEKESETALLSDKLKVELVKSKEEHEAALAGETKQGDTAYSMRLRLQELSVEAANATKENRKAEALKQEAQGFRAIAKLAEEKLEIAMKEAEEAKAGEKLANAQIFKRNSSSSFNSSTGGGERMTNNNKYSSSSSSSGKIIRLTAEEFENLTGKAERAGNSAEIEVANAMAQVEAINEREKEAKERLDEVLKEIEDIKAATHHSLMQTDVAEAAKRAVETELRKQMRLKQHYNPPKHVIRDDQPTSSSFASSI